MEKQPVEPVYIKIEPLPSMIEPKEEPMEVQDAVASTLATPFLQPIITPYKSKAQKQREYRQRIAASRTAEQAAAARKLKNERQRINRLRQAGKLASGSLEAATTSSSGSGEESSNVQTRSQRKHAQQQSTTTEDQPDELVNPMEVQEAVASTSPTPFAEPITPAPKSRAQIQREYRRRIAASKTPAQKAAAREARNARERNNRLRQAGIASGSLEAISSSRSGHWLNTVHIETQRQFADQQRQYLATEPAETTVEPSTSSVQIEVQAESTWNTKCSLYDRLRVRNDLIPITASAVKTEAEESSSIEIELEPEAETNFIYTSESTNHIEIEVEANIPDVETINTQALEVTLARIRANPQLYIGIPKNCYHLIDIIHKQTEIPTTHILLCLKKIKLDTHIEELADQFGITAKEASDIFISNVPALANILHTFVDNYELQIPLLSEHSLCVIDSLEINVQPSSDNSSELTQTERGNIVKYVVCCTPDGYINYVSPGYGGRQSDDRLLEDTNYLDRLKSGDSVMPNGLRNVEPMMLQRGLKVVKPRARQKHTASLQATQHSTINESQLSEDQLERLVQRIREFTMVRDRSVLSCDLVRVLDEAVVISCALINLQSFVIN